MLEYLRVRIADLWRFQPRSRKMIIFGVATLLIFYFVPVPRMPDELVLMLAFVGILGAYGCIFYGVYCFFIEQFKLRKMQ